MRIRRLQIKDFRRYRDLDIDFAPGLTVVRGPNEAGKSTIQRAIELAITRRATSGANDLNALRPWDAPRDARTVIGIEFEQEEVLIAGGPAGTAGPSPGHAGTSCHCRMESEHREGETAMSVKH